MSSEEKPRPQYGEYAPQAEENTAAQQPTDQAAAPLATDNANSPAPSPVEAAPAVATTPAAQVTAANSKSLLPGVPHNLGVAQRPNTAQRPNATQRPATTQQNPASQSGPYIAPPEATQKPVKQQPVAHSNKPGASDQAKPRNAVDTAATISLLLLGAYGALVSGGSMLSMREQLVMIASALNLDTASLPAAISTLGTIGALLILALYAVTLIYSIQRLRARKITFWVPLAAGVIAAVITFVISMVAITMWPELMQQLSDPTALEKILDSLSPTKA